SAVYTITPAISLNQSAGAVGSAVTLSGSSYAPNSILTVTFDGAALTTSGICITDASGYLLESGRGSCSERATTAGLHTVTASDGTAYSASAIFTVSPTIFTVIPAIYAVTPAISLNRIAGAVGSTVLLSGSTYTPNSTLTITFNGAARRTSGICITDASGYLL